MVVTMPTPRHSTPSSPPASSQNPHRQIWRPAHFNDYIVGYSDKPAMQTVRHKEPTIVRSTPKSPVIAACSHDNLMQTILDITKQQSKTARHQTELLEQVLQTRRGMPSSCHQTPWTQILKSVEKEQPTCDGSDAFSSLPPWPQSYEDKASVVEELIQVMKKLHLHSQPVSEAKTLPQQ